MKKRALVVFTDGDSQPVSSALASNFAETPQVHVTLVRLGEVSDRIYTSGIAEAGYTAGPDLRRQN